MPNTSSSNFMDMQTAHDKFEETTTMCSRFIGEVEREKMELEKNHKGQSANIFGGKLESWLGDMRRVRDSLGRMTAALIDTKNVQVQTQDVNSDKANSMVTTLNT